MTEDISERPTVVGVMRDSRLGYDPRWYVAKTKPRVERQVASILESRGIRAYLPLLKRRQRFEALFPGYLFLNMDLRTDEYLRSRAAPGISYFLCAEREPVSVPDDLVDTIRQWVEHENAMKPAERFKPGDPVLIAAGPFRDVEAIFDRSLTPQGRCIVLLHILGKLTRVQVDAGLLVKSPGLSRWT